jgi:hypothetical protein
MHGTWFTHLKKLLERMHTVSGLLLYLHTPLVWHMVYIPQEAVGRHTQGDQSVAATYIHPTYVLHGTWFTHLRKLFAGIHRVSIALLLLTYTPHVCCMAHGLHISSSFLQALTR